MDSGFRGISEEFLHFKRGRNCSTCMYALGYIGLGEFILGAGAERCEKAGQGAEGCG